MRKQGLSKPLWRTMQNYVGGEDIVFTISALDVLYEYVLNTSFVLYKKYILLYTSLVLYKNICKLIYTNLYFIFIYLHSTPG